MFFESDLTVIIGITVISQLSPQTVDNYTIKHSSKSEITKLLPFGCWHLI